MRRKILIVRLGSLGDVILTSPTVINLRLNFPDSYLVYLTREQFVPVVSMMSPVDEIIALPQDSDTRDYFALLSRLDDGWFDLAVDLHGNFRSWLARQMVTANLKATYPKRRLERWKTVKCHIHPDSVPHTIDLYNTVLGQVGGRVFCRRPLLVPPPRHGSDSDVFGGAAPTVVVAPGAAHPNKQWPVERFAEVAATLSEQIGATIIWASNGVSDVPSSLGTRLIPERLVVLEKHPIDQLATIISEAHLVIANDSGVMHLASAVGTPTIGIFGPTHKSLGFAPRGLFDRMIETDEPCRPCSLHGKRPCYREERFCFTRIEPGQVVEAALGVITKRDTLTPALFVDRDGTMIEDRHYLSDPDEVTLVPGAAPALIEARGKGYKIVVVSNQSGVARGYFPMEAVHATNQRTKDLLESQGAKVDCIYFCPHYNSGSREEFIMSCPCRKPAAGMAEQAASELSIDLRRSVVIGDKSEDLQLGAVIGGTSIGVRTGHGLTTEPELVGFWRSRRAEIVDDLQAAVRLLPRISQ